jgi:glycolate oxidase iron-sulfur subunit
MAVSSLPVLEAPRQVDLDKCVHCGLCLNACPTYRELGLEMDSPRGRVYQMAKVAEGAPITASYVEHIELCLACRACETACPSAVPYGRLVEGARAQIESAVRRGIGERFLRRLVFGHLLPSRTNLRLAAGLLWIYQHLGLRRLVRATGVLRLFGNLGKLEALSPEVELPTFFSQYGRVFPPEGGRRYRVALLGGCIANIAFARLNEATVRVLQRNGCEVIVPDGQTCCGALHVHSGLRENARTLARRNVDTLVGAGLDAIITNAAGCGSTLKEYHELLEHDAAYAEKARRFVSLVRDVNEFLASIELNTAMGEWRRKVTYQDSCHLAHGQKVKTQPRKLLGAVPGLELREMASADICCGSAGIYNVVQHEMAMAVLDRKMDAVNRTGAEVIVTANPGCMLQLKAGARSRGGGQRVMHVVEVLDEAYRSSR